MIYVHSIDNTVWRRRKRTCMSVMAGFAEMLSVAVHSLVAASQTLTVLSAEAVAKRVPALFHAHE